MHVRLRLVVLLSFGVVAIPPVSHAGDASEYIVVLKRGGDARPIAAEHARRHGAAVERVFNYALTGYAGRLTASEHEAISRDPAVLFVAEEQTFSFAGTTKTECSGCLPTAVDRIDAELSAATVGDGLGAVDIDVAVVDSGIDASHPDLDVRGGVNCAPGASYDNPKDAHGTEVAGVIAARDDNTGGVGVAPGARLWAARVSDDRGYISTSSMICALDWITSTRLDFDPGNEIDVANVSIVGPHADDGNCGSTANDALHVAICNSVAAGVVFVAAAGNNSRDFQAFGPASYDEVLTATAMADFDGLPGGLASASGTCLPKTLESRVADDSAAFFSNFATLEEDEAHTVSAPGVCLLTTAPKGKYTAVTGTSFSAPVVTGTVALCLASGACAGPPQHVVRKLVADATAYNRSKPGYGFAGDPLRPVADKYYGYLVNASGY